MMLVHIDESQLMSSQHMIGTYFVHGWMHLFMVHGWMYFFMVQVDYRLFGTGWCRVDALVYGTGWCSVDALVYG